MTMVEKEKRSELKNTILYIKNILDEKGFVDTENLVSYNSQISKKKGDKRIQININKDNTVSFLIYFSYQSYIKSNNFNNIPWLLKIIENY